MIKNEALSIERSSAIKCKDWDETLSADMFVILIMRQESLQILSKEGKEEQERRRNNATDIISCLFFQMRHD